jgi:hypothetical protein
LNLQCEGEIRRLDFTRHAPERLRCSDVPLIIVDNTNLEPADAQPYVALAYELGYDVEIVEPSTAWALDAAELVLKSPVSDCAFEHLHRDSSSAAKIVR